MASIKKDIRTNQALQVIQYSNQGMSIVEACQEVDIPRSSFCCILLKELSKSPLA